MRGEVEPKEVCILPQTIDESQLNRREALAVQLADRMADDPHKVDSGFWSELQEEFTDEELVELVFACSIFNWGNKFNITMRMDAAEDSEYPTGMEYEEIKPTG